MTGPLRAGLLLYLVIMIGIYGLVYLLPIPGWISASWENKFYCLGDASFKLGTSIMLLVVNDLMRDQEFSARADALSEDFEHLIHTASVPIIGVDLKGRISQWNLKMQAVTGLLFSSVEGIPLRDFLGSGGASHCLAMVEKAFCGDESPGVEVTSQSQDPNMEMKKAKLILSASQRRNNKGTLTGA